MGTYDYGQDGSNLYASITSTHTWNSQRSMWLYRTGSSPVWAQCNDAEVGDKNMG